MSKHLRPAVLTYHCQFLLHGLSDHVGRGDVFNPQRRINGFMFFSLSVLNLEDHLGLVISPQSPLSAGYITLRACRRSLPLRFSTVTPGGIVGFLIVSYRFNIPDRLAVHLSIHARPELRAHYTSHRRTTLGRFCHCELSLKVIRDNDVFMTTTFIPVGRLLTTHQPQFFHKPASKPASHFEVSQGCHDGDTSCASRAVADAMQFKYLTA